MVTLELVRVIVSTYFGRHVPIETGMVSYSAKSGVHRLQIVKELFSTHLVMCRAFVMGQSIGYFYFDVTNHAVSQMYADD